MPPNEFRAPANDRLGYNGPCRGFSAGGQPGTADLIVRERRKVRFYSGAAMTSRITMFLVCLGAAHTVTGDTDCWAQDRRPEPSPVTHYRGREIAQTMHYLGAPWLIRESRQREEDCQTMLGELRLKPGMTVCDMGCGNGFYTLKMAAEVGPQGTVYAVDIQPEMLRLMEARAAEAGLENIKSVLGTPVDPRLPSDALDVILCVDVYHEFSDPEPMLANIRRALKPAGVAVLVEFREEDETVPIKPLHKMSKTQIRKEWLPNGFRLTREYDELPWQHMMFFAAEPASASSSAD